MGVDYNAVGKKLWLFLWHITFQIIARILSDRIIPGHSRCLGISYDFWNTYINLTYPYKFNLKKVSHYLFDNAFHVV